MAILDFFLKRFQDSNLWYIWKKNFCYLKKGTVFLILFNGAYSFIFRKIYICICHYASWYVGNNLFNIKFALDTVGVFKTQSHVCNIRTWLDLCLLVLNIKYSNTSDSLLEHFEENCLKNLILTIFTESKLLYL